MIAELILAGAMAAPDAQVALRVWYVNANAARTHITYRIEYHSSGAGHERSFGDDRTYPISAFAPMFTGMTLEQLYSPGTHVRFENRRDAGSIIGEGWAANGNASG